jgi:hypothetical protein
MKRYIYPAITVFILLLFQLTGIAHINQQLSFSNLTLEIAPLKEEYVQLEPISLKIDLSNNNSSPIIGHSTLSFSSGYLELFIINEDKGCKIEHLSPGVASTFVKERQINPGEHIQSKDQLTLNLDTLFPVPGEYKIQAELSDGKGREKVKSRLITIRVVEPKQKDLPAFNYIKSSNHAYNFFSGVAFSNDEEKRIMEQLTSNFGESVYGDYALFNLGQIHFGEKDYDKAIEYLTKVRSKDIFPDSDKSLLLLVQIYSRLANKEKAQFYLGEMQKRFPKSNHIEQARIAIPR